MNALYGLQGAAQPYEPEPISFDRPVGDLPVVDDARWSAAFTGDSWAALLVWVLLLILLQVAMWPAVCRLFARFPDRGWGFGRLIALSVSGWIVWYLASLEVIAFRAVWCWVALGVVGVGAWSGAAMVRRRHGAHGNGTNRPFQNRTVIVAEAVFWAVFLLFLAFRLVNPDSYHPIWGGEKPMEFAHINAILRSAHFPPVDPWYADGYLNYYYYGGYLVAFMLKLTGIPTEIAFNLAQPTFAALLASGAFSVGAALARAASRSRLVMIGGGLAATVLMSLAGNLIVTARLLSGIRSPTPPLDTFTFWFWEPSRAPAAVPDIVITEFPYFSATYADLHAHVTALPLTVLIAGLVLALALGRREVALAASGPGRDAATSAVVAGRLAVLGLALGTLFMTNAWDVPTFGALAAVGVVMATRSFRGLARRIAGIVALGALVGGLAYLAALPFTSHYVALVSELAKTRSQTPLIAALSHFGVFLLIVPLALVALLVRDSRHPISLLDPLVWAALLLSVLLVRWYAVDRNEDLLLWADRLTVGIAVGMILLAAWRALPRRGDFGIPRTVLLAGTVLAWTATMYVLGEDQPVFALFGGLGLAAALLWLAWEGAAARTIAAMIAAACFVVAGAERVVLVDDLFAGTAYRMNTVFKLYNGAWTLLALSCGTLLAWLAAILLRRQPQRNARQDVGRTTDWHLVRGWSAVGAAVGVAAILASLTFPIFSTSARLGQHFDDPGATTTLNALDWMSYGTIWTQQPKAQDREDAEEARLDLGEPVELSYAEDRAVIEWFNAEVPGTPVIAEASFAPYRCGGSRISIHTGLPTVIGWVRHEMQQRYQTHLVERSNDVRTLYTSEDPDEKLRIIDQYRIEYIVVGELERNYPINVCVATANAGGIEAFSPLVGSRLEVAFTAGETVVYRVL